MYAAITQLHQLTRVTSVCVSCSWDGYAQRLMNDAELQQIKEEIEDKAMVYPNYYLKPFHACKAWLCAAVIASFSGVQTWRSACDCFLSLIMPSFKLVHTYEQLMQTMRAT